LLFSVLRTAVCEPVSMATDPNVVIVTLLALKEYASDLQTFLGSKSIEVEVE
jgi:hypothetical protein